MTLDTKDCHYAAAPSPSAGRHGAAVCRSASAIHRPSWCRYMPQCLRHQPAIVVPPSETGSLLAAGCHSSATRHSRTACAA
uniref:Uncharacterized protein n=1 Tax=Oryza glumipatula TaxID=40148 RepID=A0A0D9Y382_9ORYZ